MRLLPRILIASAVVLAPLGVTTTAAAATPTCNAQYVAGLPNNQRVGFPVYQVGTHRDRNCIVNSGAHGSHVTYIQWALRDCHRINPGPADGKYGPKTKAAVAAFQRSVGIPADGIYGPRTEDFMQWKVWEGDRWTGCRR